MNLASKIALGLAGVTTVAAAVAVAMFYTDENEDAIQVAEDFTAAAEEAVDSAADAAAETVEPETTK